jgi:hypothetical protein
VGYVPGTLLSVSPETLLYSVDGDTPTNQDIGYDKMKISTEDVNLQINYDKNGKKASLINRK